MRRFIGALLALLLLAGGLAWLAPRAPEFAAEEAPHGPAVSATVQPVNAVLGDESFVATYGRAPASNTPEDVRLRTHLAYVEGLLRARNVRDLSEAQRARRLRLLGDLRAYWQAGVFPRNTKRPGRTPVFIDEQGRLCAVGYLIAQSAGRAAAERINADFTYAAIRDIPLPVLGEWAEKNGFTRRELAMIQPAYCWTHPDDPRCNPDADEQTMSEGVEIASLSFNAASALVNGYLAGTGRPSRLVAGAGLIGGGEAHHPAEAAHEGGVDAFFPDEGRGELHGVVSAQVLLEGQLLGTVYDGAAYLQTKDIRPVVLEGAEHGAGFLASDDLHADGLRKGGSHLCTTNNRRALNVGLCDDAPGLWRA